MQNNLLNSFVIMSACLAGLLSACARPQGDFDRPRPSFTHDVLLPKAGFYSSKLKDEPVSSYPMTPYEKKMRDIAWRLVVPPHSKDWIGKTASDIQRAQIINRLDLQIKPETYAKLLLKDPYRESHIRYHRIHEDAALDIISIAPFFNVLEKVQNDDAKRLSSVKLLPDITPKELANVIGRVSENQRYRAWVLRALYFRLYAYRYALDRFMIATPYKNASETVSGLDRLEQEIEKYWTRGQGVYPAIQNLSPSQPYDLMEPMRKG